MQQFTDFILQNFAPIGQQSPIEMSTNDIFEIFANHMPLDNFTLSVVAKTLNDLKFQTVNVGEFNPQWQLFPINN